MHAREKHASDAILAEQLFHVRRAGMEAKIAADHRGDALTLEQFDQVGKARRNVRQGLLDEE